MINTFIFDLDGVIVDTARYHFLAWRELADGLDIPFTSDDNEKLKGVSRMQSLEIILSLGNKALSEEEKHRLADKKNQRFLEFVNAITPSELLPGVESLLRNLHAHNFKTAIGSSSKNAATVLEKLGIRDMFDVIADGNMIQHSKPDPEIFLLAAKLARAEPDQCIVFEDAEAGIEAALRAGMLAVGIGSPAVLNKAHWVIPGVHAFQLSMLSEINSKPQF